MQRGWGLTQKWQPAGWGIIFQGPSRKGPAWKKTKSKTATTKEEQPSFWPGLLPRHFCFVPSQPPHRSSHRAFMGWVPWRCPLFHFILLRALRGELLVSALQMTSLRSGRPAWVAGWLGNTLEFMNAAPSRILEFFFLPWFLFIPSLNCHGLQAHHLPLWESSTCVLTEEIPTHHLNFGFALSSGGQPSVSAAMLGVSLRKRVNRSRNASLLGSAILLTGTEMQGHLDETKVLGGLLEAQMPLNCFQILARASISFHSLELREPFLQWLLSAYFIPVQLLMSQKVSAFPLTLIFCYLF